MKRRDFVKTLPAAAIVSAAACSPAGDAVTVDTPAPAPAPDPRASNESPKGFSVQNPNLDDLSVHDTIHCDHFGLDPEGNAIPDSLTGTDSDAGPK